MPPRAVCTPGISGSSLDIWLASRTPVPGIQACVWGEKERSLWDEAPTICPEDLVLTMTHLDVQILTLVWQGAGYVFREGKQNLDISCWEKSICQRPASQHFTNQLPVIWSKVLPLGCEDF